MHLFDNLQPLGEQLGLPRVAELLEYYATMDRDENAAPASLLEKLGR
jgi:hypothetical protein